MLARATSSVRPRPTNSSDALKTPQTLKTRPRRLRARADAIQRHGERRKPETGKRRLEGPRTDRKRERERERERERRERPPSLSPLLFLVRLFFFLLSNTPHHTHTRTHSRPRRAREELNLGLGPEGGPFLDLSRRTHFSRLGWPPLLSIMVNDSHASFSIRLHVCSPVDCDPFLND